MARAVWKGPFVEESLMKKVDKYKDDPKKKPIRTWSRKSTILPDFVGVSFQIYNGKKFIPITVSEDMVVTNMELVNRKFKMTVYTRFDTINPSNTAYKKGKDFETRLKDSGFIDYFKKDSQGDPEFSAVKYEDDNIDGNKVHKIVFQGEIEKTLQKKRLRSKRRK